GLYVMTDSGIAKILKVEENMVSLDFNHPLAGKTLIFEVEVIEVKKSEADVDKGSTLEDN
ncbi:MAG: hypothetical protein ABGW50_05275, partial [Thermococcus sp.]